MHGADKSVEIWRIRSDSEVQKVLARKRKRRREKQKDAQGDEDMTNVDEEAGDVSKADISDVFARYTIIRTGGKVRSEPYLKG